MRESKISTSTKSITAYLKACRCPVYDETIDAERRIRTYENEGMTRSDAQGTYEADLIKERMKTK